MRSGELHLGKQQMLPSQRREVPLAMEEGRYTSAEDVSPILQRRIRILTRSVSGDPVLHARSSSHRPVIRLSDCEANVAILC